MSLEVYSVLRDLRYGVRMLFKQRGVTLIAILTLALGIGGSTAIFTVVDAVILRALPYPNADRLVLVREVSPEGATRSLSDPNFADLQAGSNSFSALATAGGGDLVVTGGNEPVRTRVYYASEHLFDVLGVQPVAGRTFLPEETVYGGPTAVLISHGFWQRHLGGRPDFSSVQLNVDGVGCTVVGVMPQGFSYPADAEVWVTRSIEPPGTSRKMHGLPVIGRLRSDVTFEQARAEVSIIGKQLREQFGGATDAVDFTLFPLQQYLTRNAREGLYLLLGAVGLLLLVACANVSNLLLAQFLARQQEFTLRAALGASRIRLSRQLILENLLVTLTAASLGALLAAYGVDLLLFLNQDNLPAINLISVGWRELLFALLLAILIAIGLGSLPALRFSKGSLASGLKTSATRHTADVASSRLSSGLVVLQIGLTLVLLTGAGLLGRSFMKLSQIDPGFTTKNALAMTLALPSTVTPLEDERLRQFYVQLLTRLEQLPGVTAVGGINVLPLADQGASGTFLIDDNPVLKGYAGYRVASAGYFAAAGIPLLRGRFFETGDTVDSPHVALISQSLADAYWPNEDPIGKRIQFGNMDTDKRLLHIIGVVGDVRDASLEKDGGPRVYSYSLQRPQWWQVSRLSIVIRAESDPKALIPAMRSAVQDLRSDVPTSFRTLQQVFSSSFDQRRFSIVLFGIFAVIALLIATIGIYAVISYAVSQRTHEIGLRMALGAQAKDVLRLVVGHGMRMTMVGLAVGLIAAVGLTRLMESLLFDVSTTDPITLVAILAMFTLVAAVACYIPARRATLVDPMVVLRHE